MTTLCPAQQAAFEDLQRGLTRGNVLTLRGATGLGKTTVLRALREAHGGAFLSVADLINLLRGAHPLQVEEAFDKILRDAIAVHKVVILDDLDLIYDVVCGCGGFSTYPRPKFIHAPLTMLCTLAAESGKTLVFGTRSAAPPPVAERGYSFSLDGFEPADYAHLARAFLPAGAVGRLDYGKIHRFAPKLNAHQIKSACDWLTPAKIARAPLDTENFLEYLRSQQMASNVDLDEVQAVELGSLKGIDDVIESLEANIVLPLEDDALATELGIKPKRGVLLAGPPGTGKTTVGRALAHRLGGKFFLIDGTFIAGTRNFYERVHGVFEAAKQNAPSVLFIDDSDVLFADDEAQGLYRYLLTLLDGLESASAGRVCVMLTAMDVGKLPPALVRSGRIELWLETRPPDEEARTAILREQTAGLPAALGVPEIETLAQATDGLTGADLKRLVEDGRILAAYDRSQRRTPKTATEYFLAAIETVRANNARYARAAELSSPPRRVTLPFRLGALE